MNIELRAELVKPRDVKYSWPTTLKTPFPIPFSTAARRKSFAGADTLSGTIDFRSNSTPSG